MYAEFIKNFDLTIDEIDKDIVILRKFNLAPSIKHISQTEFKDVQKAINNLLLEYKKLLKENEELNSKILSNAGIYQLGLKDARKEIKVKIESELEKAEKDLQEAIRLEKESKEKEGTILWWTAQIRADERINVLKEMLKGVKKDGDNV